MILSKDRFLELDAMRGIAALSVVLCHTIWKPIFDFKKEQNYVLYPYENGKLIPEKEFEKKYPATYEYLLKNKKDLLKRDSGKIPEKKWYGFGREQAIQISKAENVLYIPNIMNPKKPIIVKAKPTLFKNCLMIESEMDLNELKEKILSQIELLKDISQKKSSGYISITTTNLLKLSL